MKQVHYTTIGVNEDLSLFIDKSSDKYNNAYVSGINGVGYNGIIFTKSQLLQILNSMGDQDVLKVLCSHSGKGTTPKCDDYIQFR